MKRYTEIIELLGIMILFSFTVWVTGFAIYGKGAYIYYYEPNLFIWTTEVLLGSFACLIGIWMIGKKTKNLLK